MSKNRSTQWNKILSEEAVLFLGTFSWANFLVWSLPWYCLNPIRREFGDRKISGPEGDFVGPQTLFAWDLRS